jgi:hypothetical protein
MHILCLAFCSTLNRSQSHLFLMFTSFSYHFILYFFTSQFFLRELSNSFYLNVCNTVKVQYKYLLVAFKKTSLFHYIFAGFHNRWNLQVGISHPNSWICLTKLKDEEKTFVRHFTEQNVVIYHQLERGAIVCCRDVYVI